MAGIGNGKRKPDGNVEISLQTGRTTNRKTKPPARRITIITTTATTIRTKTKNPIQVITDRHPKTQNGRKRIWGRNLVRMENLPRPSDLVNLPIICVSSAVELDIQQRIVPKPRKLKEEPHRSRHPTANPPRTQKNKQQLLEPARTSGCDDLDHAIEEVRLNASTPFTQCSVFIYYNFTFTKYHNFQSFSGFGFHTLFHRLPFCQIKKYDCLFYKPKLFDGSSSSHMITKAIDIPLQIAPRHITPFTFYVTMLDPLCVVVLGYNWLTCYHLLIDWVLSSITFRSTHIENPVPETRPSMRASVSEEMELPSTSDPFDPEFQAESTTPLVKPKIDISLINAVAFLWACSLPGSQQFSLNLADIEVSGCSASTSKLPDPVDLSNVPEEYHEFADVFDKAKAQTLAPHRPYDLKINLEEGYTPPLGQVYSLSQTELKALREFLDENLAAGFISSTRSPHRAPILFVKKKDGGLRLCVDFRGLNKITKKDRYPLPLIMDLLDSPGKARIYTKIDLQHAYHLVHIAKGDEWKTAFWTCYGSFEWKVMPFGLTNAPAAFQHFMNDIFADMVDGCVIIYLDDILVYSDNIDQHRTHIREVLRWLHKHGLYAGAHKCSFHQDTVEYLGYILSPSGLTMDPAKVQTIQDWPEPHKIKEIQSFLGFANFYRRFIHAYSDIVIPLTWLTHKDTKWDFSEKCRKVFNDLKTAFLSAL